MNLLKTIRSVTSIIFAFAWVVSGIRAAVPQPLWSLVAKSPIIAAGTIEVPVDEIKQHLASGRHDYVDLSIANAEFLKGHAPESFWIRWYTEARSYAPDFTTLSRLNGSRVIVFALRAGEKSRTAIYFAGSTPDAVSSMDDEFLNLLRVEISEQSKILAAFPQGFAPVSTGNIEVVRHLLDESTEKGKAEAAFEKLLALNRDFVPAIITLMDDRREVAAEWLQISNPPNHWEAFALYKPEQVVDALDGILSKKTGSRFIHIVNGDSEENRRASIDAWRIYLYHLQMESQSLSPIRKG